MYYLTDSDEVSEAEARVRETLKDTTVYIVGENKWRRKGFGNIEISEINAADLPGEIDGSNGKSFYFFTKTDVVNFLFDGGVEEDELADFKSKLEAKFEGDPLFFASGWVKFLDLNNYEIIEEKPAIILEKYEGCVQENLDAIKSNISRYARCSEDLDKLDRYFFFQYKEEAEEYKNELLEEEDE